MSPSIRIWNTTTQNSRIFGWAEILQSWSDNLRTSPYIETVRDNLRFATEFPHSYSFPLSHFTNYLNQEQEGIKWLIYEICAVRWMFGRVCVDYLRDLVDLVDLDSGFPEFVGSPGRTQTIREFLENQLTGDEMYSVHMMPRLEAYSPPSPPRVVRRPAAAAAVAAAHTKRSPIVLRFLRDCDKENDDVLKIYPTGTDVYTVFFNDMQSEMKSRARSFNRADVLKHLSNVLRLVEMDEDPYKSVQLIAPNVPTVIFNTKSLTSQLRDLIYDTVEVTMDHWPVTVV